MEHVKYISYLCKTACSGKYTSRVALHAVLQRLEKYFTRSTTCGLTEIGKILHVFHYMRFYRDWKCTSHVPLHAVLQRLEIYFMRSTTCGLTELEIPPYVVLHRLEMYFTYSITLFLICIRPHVVEHEAHCKPNIRCHPQLS